MLFLVHMAKIDLLSGLLMGSGATIYFPSWLMGNILTGEQSFQKTRKFGAFLFFSGAALSLRRPMLHLVKNMNKRDLF